MRELCKTDRSRNVSPGLAPDRSSGAEEKMMIPKTLPHWRQPFETWPCRVTGTPIFLCSCHECVSRQITKEKTPKSPEMWVYVLLGLLLVAAIASWWLP